MSVSAESIAELRLLLALAILRDGVAVQPAEEDAPQPTPADAMAAATPGRNRDLTDAGATTAIHIPKADLVLLRRVSVERANRIGGRPSVSNVLRDMIDLHRADLEAEVES